MIAIKYYLNLNMPVELGLLDLKKKKEITEWH